MYLRIGTVQHEVILVELGLQVEGVPPLHDVVTLVLFDGHRLFVQFVIDALLVDLVEQLHQFQHLSSPVIVEVRLGHRVLIDNVPGRLMVVLDSRRGEVLLILELENSVGDEDVVVDEPLKQSVFLLLASEAVHPEKGIEKEDTRLQAGMLVHVIEISTGKRVLQPMLDFKQLLLSYIFHI